MGGEEATLDPACLDMDTRFNQWGNRMTTTGNRYYAGEYIDPENILSLKKPHAAFQEIGFRGN